MMNDYDFDDSVKLVTFFEMHKRNVASLYREFKDDKKEIQEDIEAAKKEIIENTNRVGAVVSANTNYVGSVVSGNTNSKAVEIKQAIQSAQTNVFESIAQQTKEITADTKNQADRVIRAIPNA